MDFSMWKLATVVKKGRCECGQGYEWLEENTGEFIEVIWGLDIKGRKEKEYFCRTCHRPIHIITVNKK